MESKESLIQSLKEVEAWEKGQNDLWFWEKLGRLPFVLLDRITPAFVREKLGLAVDEMTAFLETGGTYLVQDEPIYNRFRKRMKEGSSSNIGVDEIAAAPLSLMNEVAMELRESRATFATVQGATTGIGGIFTLALDIPLLIGTSLKVLQEMSLSYGYRPEEKKERLFVVKCLQFASSDIVGKKAILAELSHFDDPHAQKDVIAQLQGWREVVVTYTENFGWKKLFQMVPIAGILFGAYLNRSTVQDVAEAGMMLYRKRRILERMREIDQRDRINSTIPPQ
ncbi:EcsC family protein [Brevibacillus invocatus]|uniref:EcsC family protein n=1 Tax=Brevibacillus invocatus TaxID=173959 RepID=A0A3M8C5X4_9BACL|nr:EcsC family protein [Brevibacillus invocatus]MCM3079283.1 EcsC family protein [Brevibacillus invocatus]MCM3429381.1 EcsC family protein [Brevibacillus invocatus]RNB70315.1 EcsC family protein [Brevibacillus invocatus]